MGLPAGVVWGRLPCFVEGLCAGRGGRPAGAGASEGSVSGGFPLLGGERE